MTTLIDNLDILLRSIIAVTVLFVMTRLMGKKQISQLSFFDYVVGISIGSIAAALSIDDTIEYSHGIIALVTWASLSIIVTYTSLKNIKAREIIEGKSTLLIKNGIILEENLRKERYNINDLIEELRMKGIFNIAEVEFAILETSGRVSVQPKSQKQPLTPSDLNMPTKYIGLSVNLIIDGDIIQPNLKRVNLDEDWLIKELRKKGINSPGEVLLASLDTDGILYISAKNKKEG